MALTVGPSRTYEIHAELPLAAARNRPSRTPSSPIFSTCRMASFGPWQWTSAGSRARTTQFPDRARSPVSYYWFLTSSGRNPAISDVLLRARRIPPACGRIDAPGFLPDSRQSQRKERGWGSAVAIRQRRMELAPRVASKQESPALADTRPGKTLVRRLTAN